MQDTKELEIRKELEKNSEVNVSPQSPRGLTRMKAHYSLYMLTHKQFQRKKESQTYFSVIRDHPAASLSNNFPLVLSFFTVVLHSLAHPLPMIISRLSHRNDIDEFAKKKTHTHIQQLSISDIDFEPTERAF